MGVKSWMLVYADEGVDIVKTLRENAKLDIEATEVLANILFPDKILSQEPITLENTAPEDNEVFIGYFSGVTIIASTELALDYPSQLDERFIAYSKGKRLYLHAQHSVVDWFAFAIWQDGKLKRSLSISSDDGIIEDIGEHLTCEVAYWEGKDSLSELEDIEDEAYPFSFNPLDLAEEVRLDLFGYIIEGIPDETQVNPSTVELMLFKEKKPWWKFW